MSRPTFWSQRRSARSASRCLEVARLLQSYLDGQLGSWSATTMARHLDECRRCGPEAEIYIEIKKALARCDRNVSGEAVTRLEEFAQALSRPNP